MIFFLKCTDFKDFFFENCTDCTDFEKKCTDRTVFFENCTDFFSKIVRIVRIFSKKFGHPGIINVLNSII